MPVEQTRPEDHNEHDTESKQATSALYRHLADLGSYAQAQQRLEELYSDQEAWTRKVILNIAGSGQFSSDRTIAQYAKEIWNTEPCLTDLP